MLGWPRARPQMRTIPATVQRGAAARRAGCAAATSPRRAALGGRPRWSPCACRPRVAGYGQQRGGEPAFRRTSCARPRPGQEPASRYVRVAVGTCGCCAGDDESATPTASTTPSPILIAENRSTGVVRDQTGPGRPDGPRSVRMAPGIPGSRRARAVTPGSMNPQVDARSRL